MTRQLTTKFAAIMLLIALISGGAGCSNQTDEVGTDSREEQDDHDNGLSVTLDAAEREAAGIRTASVERVRLTDEIRAPGEVIVNAYATSRVTPRIAAQVVSRHARLGETVEIGQPLVTLSSVELSRGQSDLLVADREWNRVRDLGREVVSDRRYTEARAARQEAYARVMAYGMTAEQVDSLLGTQDVSQAIGEFDLVAPQVGVIIYDEFIVGEMAEPGQLLFEISDESRLWVEAKLAPEDAARVAIDASARVSVGGEAWVPGRVIQIHHQLDETTRTQSVRIELDNRDDHLHPGQFVQALVQTGQTKPVIAVPRDAVVLMENAPTVFMVEGDEFHAQQVETGHAHAELVEVLAGLEEGDEIVVNGAFLLKSLALKSRMGEGHTH